MGVPLIPIVNYLGKRTCELVKGLDVCANDKNYYYKKDITTQLVNIVEYAHKLRGRVETDEEFLRILEFLETVSGIAHLYLNASIPIHGNKLFKYCK